MNAMDLSLPRIMGSIVIVEELLADHIAFIADLFMHRDEVSEEMNR